MGAVAANGLSLLMKSKKTVPIGVAVLLVGLSLLVHSGYSEIVSGIARLQTNQKNLISSTWNVYEMELLYILTEAEFQKLNIKIDLPDPIELKRRETEWQKAQAQVMEETSKPAEALVTLQASMLDLSGGANPISSKPSD